MEENKVENQQENSDKVTKEFDNNIKQLSVLLNGEKNIRAGRAVKNDAVKQLVIELLAERNKAGQEALKAEIITLLDSKVEMDKAFKAKEEELKKLKESKLKEFNEKAKKIFSKVEDMKQLTIDYESSLKGIDKLNKE